MKIDYDFCVSSYLAFRYVAREGIAWKAGVIPIFPNEEEQGEFKVKTPAEVVESLRQIVRESCHDKKVGVLLSAGIDSAIVAALLPPGTPAYTIQFVAPDSIDEVPTARGVAKALGLNHNVVSVTWNDYNETSDLLMKRKKAPLHPAEVGLYKASCAAKKDGIDLLAVGNGADSTFGGMDKLLSKDWTFDEFVQRYMFLEPVRALKKPASVVEIFEPYRRDNGFNVPAFLKAVHGLGVIQMFENAIHAGDCTLVAPFEKLALDAPLDLNRIRAGEPKYILRDVFRRLCPGLQIPAKIPFARPVTQWLSDWRGPKRAEFLDGLSMGDFTGEQKWQLYCLERFLGLLDREEI